jgi:hypothetical protein
MHRRLLLAASAAGAIGAAFGPAPETALDDAWKAATTVDTAWWHDRVAAVAADFVAAPAAEMRTRLGADLRVLAEMFLPESLRAPTAQLVCMYARVQTTTGDAARWMNEAITVARASQDASTLGWVYGRAALEVSHGAAHALAFEYARTAGEIADAAPSQMAQVGAFNALVGAAHASVTAGDVERATAYWQQAQYAYDHIDTDGESDFGCTLERMALNASHLLSRMGDASAEDWTAEAFGSRDDDRYRTYSGIHQALRAHAVGDPTAAGLAQAVIDAVPAEDQWASLKRMAAAAGANVQGTPTRAALA